MSSLVLLFAVTLTSATASFAAPPIFPSSTGPLVVETLATGLVRPWSFAFLPDGRLLVTERPGRMRIIASEGSLSPPIAGLPKIYAYDQVGLADVALDRNFRNNRLLYF